MYAASTNTSTDTWTSSGWVIRPGHELSLFEASPFGDFVAEELSCPAQLNDILLILDTEEQLEQLEDIKAAREAEDEYNLHGIEDTISYTDYRTRRLGTEASV